MVAALWLSSFNGKASHIVGGDLHYTWLGNDQYLVTLKVYRDCATSSTPFDNPASIGVYNGSTLVMNIEIPISDAVITLLPVETNSVCVSPPSGICVEEAIFSKTVTLPPNANGYTLAYQRCCRNVTLVNTTSNDDLGITLTTTIPPQALAYPNSNPQFTEYPPIVICLNYPFVFDHSATDADGDQLVYEFCNPLLSNVPGFYINPPGAPPYPPLIFNAGYSFSNPISSDPAFSIDPVTGLLTGTPNLPGQFVVGICVKEYRNGQLINSTNRDFQFNVVVCNPNVFAAIAEQENDCTGLTVQLDNLSTAGMTYWWDFGDPTTEADTSGLYEPQYTYPDTGYYLISLIVNPGLPCADTAYMNFHAAPQLLPVISTYEATCINGLMYYDFYGEGGFSGNALFAWNFGNNASPQTSSQQNPQQVVLSTTSASVEVTLTIFDSICQESLTQTIQVPAQPIASIAPQETFCNGFYYQFENTSLNAQNYYWDFGAPGTSDVSTAINPEYMYADTGHYTIMLIATAPGLCADTAYTQLSIYGLLQALFAAPAPQCFEGNSFSFQALGATTSQATYLWNFGSQAVPVQSSLQNPAGVYFNQPGTYPVYLTVFENDCESTAFAEVEVIPNPLIDAWLDNAEGCPELYVAFHNNSWATTPLSYLWQFGDGTTSTEANPTHIYATPGAYDVSLTISTQSGCIETLQLTLTDAVEVWPAPQAGFHIEPGVTDLLAGQVEIIDGSLNAGHCLYYMPDGTLITDCNFIYSFNTGGVQLITQVVTNEAGCSDMATGYFIVSGLVFFAPNAFTPTTDGINEVWQPVVLGARDYRLQIFDRWGERIFETNEPQEPWIGNVHGGQHFAPDGVYIYDAVLHDMAGYPYHYTGHITLLR